MSTLEAILQETLPHVCFLAHRLATSTDPVWDAEDLYQEGAIGLLALAERYDATRGATLWTYAEFRVLGAMRDARRELDPVPRSLRTKARVIAQAVQALAQQLGRAPEGDEIAPALGLSQKTYEAWRTAVAGAARPRSLDYTYPLAEEQTPQRGTQATLFSFLVTPGPGPDAHVERAEEQRQSKTLLSRALALLPAREAQVLRLRYWEEQTLKTIGAQLGLSESRVSQLHSAAIQRLQRWLTTDADWPALAARLEQQRANRQARTLALQGLKRWHGNAAYLRAWRAQRKETHRD